MTGIIANNNSHRTIKNNSLDQHCTSANGVTATNGNGYSRPNSNMNSTTNGISPIAVMNSTNGVLNHNGSKETNGQKVAGEALYYPYTEVI